MNRQTQHKRPKFTLEFKQDAAKLVIEKGYPYQQAADSLGVSLSAIGLWVSAERSPALASSDKNAHLNLTEQGELIRLCKEIEELLLERAILKKAAVFFAKEVE